MNDATSHGGTRVLSQTASIKDWLGRTRREQDEIALGAVRRHAALLDQDPAAYRQGSEMPEAWYAMLFGPTAKQSTLGPDGHPKTGDFLPPLEGTRRMFAGRRVKFLKPMKVGDTVDRVSTIAQAEPKTGRSGSFTLVTVVHELTSSSGGAITEEQDLVYREAVSDPNASAAAAAKPGAAPKAEAGPKPDWSHPWTPDTVQLFRYGALTFNAHRIHYDLPYTREKEGYPALVVNGGLTALMLVESARPHLPGAIAGYDARAMKPLFIGGSVTLNGRMAGEGAELWASGPDGGVNYRLGVTLKGR
jgi:3-methylfumaryl-CoA hydratase